MKLKLLILATIICIAYNNSIGQSNSDTTYARQFIGSTAFIILTPLLDPSPEYFQLNYGYRLSKKDVISFEAITWKYTGPLGRPYGPQYENKESDFPGSITAIGAGLAYKRFLWKGLFGQIHSTAFKQIFRDENDHKIRNGFQLFNSLRLGYSIKLFKNRMFIEPSVACTYWPINTNLPDAFQIEENKWNNFFLFEPGLQFGINF